MLAAQLARLAAIDGAALPDGGERLRRRRADLRDQIAALEGREPGPAPSSSDSAPARTGSPGVEVDGGARCTRADHLPAKATKGAATSSRITGDGHGRATSAQADRLLELAPAAVPQGQVAGDEPAAGLADAHRAHGQPPRGTMRGALGGSGKAEPHAAQMEERARPSAAGGPPSAAGQGLRDNFQAALRTPLPAAAAPPARAGARSSSASTNVSGTAATGRCPAILPTGDGERGGRRVPAEVLSVAAGRELAGCAPGAPQHAAQQRAPGTLPAQRSGAAAAENDVPGRTATTGGLVPGAQQHTAPVPPSASDPVAARPTGAPVLGRQGGDRRVHERNPHGNIADPTRGLAEKGGPLEEIARVRAQVRGMKARLQALLSQLGDAACLAALPDSGRQVGPLSASSCTL